MMWLLYVRMVVLRLHDNLMLQARADPHAGPVLAVPSPRARVLHRGHRLGRARRMKEALLRSQALPPWCAQPAAPSNQSTSGRHLRCATTACTSGEATICDKTCRGCLRLFAPLLRTPLTFSHLALALPLRILTKAFPLFLKVSALTCTSLLVSLLLFPPPSITQLPIAFSLSLPPSVLFFIASSILFRPSTLKFIIILPISLPRRRTVIPTSIITGDSVSAIVITPCPVLLPIIASIPIPFVFILIPSPPVSIPVLLFAPIAVPLLLLLLAPFSLPLALSLLIAFALSFLLLLSLPFFFLFLLLPFALFLAFILIFPSALLTLSVLIFTFSSLLLFFSTSPLAVLFLPLLSLCGLCLLSGSAGALLLSCGLRCCTLALPALNFLLTRSRIVRSLSVGVGRFLSFPIASLLHYVSVKIAGLRIFAGAHEVGLRLRHHLCIPSPAALRGCVQRGYGKDAVHPLDLHLVNLKCLFSAETGEI
mmetsp:Transcript_108085/g.187543  ORF Transcript_108085/g.187543 Transcript_108085/m.187543 type:complete len:480 (-) Transcript_108085:445-1884(-)